MKNMNYKIVALTISGALLLSGCETMQQASSAMGSTGTGVLAGGVAGAGAGVLCDKLSHGNATGACVAAGMAVGAAVGTWAASWDEAAAKTVPTRDCKSVQKKLNYPTTDNKQPEGVLSIDKSKFTPVVKSGQNQNVYLKLDLAAPETDKENGVPFKVQMSGDENSTNNKAITWVCGGDYSLPAIPVDSSKQGPHNINIKLFNAADNTDIKGAQTSICYTVANDGVNKCSKVSTQAALEKSVEPGKKSAAKKRNLKG